MKIYKGIDELIEIDAEALKADAQMVSEVKVLLDVNDVGAILSNVEGSAEFKE